MPIIRMTGIALLAVTSAEAFAAKLEFNNVCPNPRVEHCAHVGKTAQNNAMNPPALRGIELGTITGVSWKKQGAVIDVSDALPSAGIPADVRLSPRDAFYFIIDDGAGNTFLRQAVEIEAK